MSPKFAITEGSRNMRAFRTFLAAMIVVALIQPSFAQDKKSSNTSSKSPSSSQPKQPASNSSSKPPSNSSAKPPSSSQPKQPASNNSSKPPSNSSAKPPSSSQPKQPANNPDKQQPKAESPDTSKTNPNVSKQPASNSPKSSAKTDPIDRPPTNVSKKPPTSAEKTNPDPIATQKSNPNFGTTNPSEPPNSKKPTAVAGTAKADAAKAEASRRKYVESQKAKLPPKTEYKTAEGKTVNVKPDSPTVKTIRDKPSTYYRPEVREQRTVEHVHHYHYQHPSTWYYSQPTVYVGGGYSSAFYWMMMEWDAERRAQWFYNHRNTIERDAYERGMRDSAVAARVAELQSQGVRTNPDYVDPEFAKDPSMMYTQDHIEAVYNPEISNGNSGATVLLLTLGTVGLCVAAYFVLFKIRWGK